MINLLKSVSFALPKKVLITFIVNIENANRVKLKEFRNDSIIKIIIYYNNVEINMHVLNTWTVD